MRTGRQVRGSNNFKRIPIKSKVNLFNLSLVTTYWTIFIQITTLCSGLVSVQIIVHNCLGTNSNLVLEGRHHGLLGDS